MAKYSRYPPQRGMGTLFNLNSINPSRFPQTSIPRNVVVVALSFPFFPVPAAAVDLQGSSVRRFSGGRCQPKKPARLALTLPTEVP